MSRTIEDMEKQIAELQAKLKEKEINNSVSVSASQLNNNQANHNQAAEGQPQSPSYNEVGPPSANSLILSDYLAQPVVNNNSEVINLLREGQKIERNGNCTIKCNVPKNAIIQVTNGSITVEGDVEESAQLIQIIINNAANFNGRGVFIGSGAIISGGSIFINGFQLGSNPPEYAVTVHGKVHADAIITAASKVICNDLGYRAEIKTSDGSITVGNVERSAKLTTYNGALKAKNIGTNTVLIANKGNINVLQVSSNARLITVDGDIEAGDIDSFAVLSATNGNIKAKNVKRAARLITMKTIYNISNCNIQVISVECKKSLSAAGSIEITGRGFGKCVIM